MKSRWIRLLAILFTFALLASACGGSDSDGGDGADVADETATGDGEETPDETTSDDAPEEDAPADDASCDATVPGSQINYGVFAPNRAFDPTASSGALVGGTELAAVYDVLFIFNPDTFEITPHLAESLTPNDDFTTWTLKLRDGITYSDGTALTAQMVSDNIDRYFREGAANAAGGFLQYIDTKTAIDDLTLEMELNIPIAQLDMIFADEPGMVVNTNVIGDDLDAFGAMPPDAAGVGPYVVETNIPGEETVLVARDDYWGGPVCVERLRFVWVPGAAATYDAFKNGDLNVGFLRDPVVIAAADDDGANSYYFNQDGGLLYALNLRDERQTSDIRLREAIALAIDPEVINNRAYQDQLEVSKSLFGPSSRFYSDAMIPMETDVARATEIVDELKAEGWDGNLQFEIQNSPPGPDAGLAVEGMLAAVGITANVSSLPITENIGKLTVGDFDMIQNGINSGPGTALLSLVRSFSSGSTGNRAGYNSPEMDALLDEALATPSADLSEVMTRINDQFNADFVGVPVGSTKEGIVWADNISGIVPTVSTIFLFHDAVVE